MAPVKRMDALKKQLGEMEQQVRAASLTQSIKISSLKMGFPCTPV